MGFFYSARFNFDISCFFFLFTKHLMFLFSNVMTQHLIKKKIN